MARRSDHSREELKELAVKAGLEIIKNEGLNDFSARKVAARIGYTIGTLYNVFGTYDDMILHINARTLDEWFAFMQGAMARKQKGNLLHRLAKAYIEYSGANYQQWIALFEYRFAEGRELPEWYVQKMTRFFTMVEDVLYPVLHKDRREARRCAHVLWAGIHGICVLSLSKKLNLVGAESAEILASSFVDNYMAGVTHA